MRERGNEGSRGKNLSCCVSKIIMSTLETFSFYDTSGQKIHCCPHGEFFIINPEQRHWITAPSHIANNKVSVS